MAALIISADLKSAIENEIGRLELRAMRNKWRSDCAGAVVILLGACSGILIGVPDSTLARFDVSIARQIFPVLTAAAYAAMRYYRWGDKHLWYWYQRHRLKGLLIRGSDGDSGLAREFAEILLTAEANYPQPVYVPPDAGSRTEKDLSPSQNALEKSAFERP